MQPSQKRSFLNHLHSLSLLFRSTRDSDRVRNSRFRALDIADQPRLDGLERGVVASHFHDVIGHHLLFKLVGKAGRRRLVGHSIFAAADYSGDRGNFKIHGPIRCPMSGRRPPIRQAPRVPRCMRYPSIDHGGAGRNGCAEKCESTLAHHDFVETPGRVRRLALRDFPC